MSTIHIFRFNGQKLAHVKKIDPIRIRFTESRAETWRVPNWCVHRCIKIELDSVNLRVAAKDFNIINGLKI